MIREAVGNDEQLIDHLIVTLTQYNEMNEALYWAREYNIPENLWPTCVQEYASNNSLK